MRKDSLKPDEHIRHPSGKLYNRRELYAEIERLKLILTKHIAWTCCNQSLSQAEAAKLIGEINTRTPDQK
jgi:hypothetical protein